MSDSGDDIQALSIVLKMDDTRYEQTLMAGLKKTESHVNKLNAYLNDATRQLGTVLQEQAASFGMNARQAEIHKLAMMGATKAQLETAKAADKVISRLEAEQEEFNQWAAVRDKVEGVTQAAQHQAATFGMTANQVQLYNLRMMGVSSADRMAANAAMNHVAKLQQQAEALQRGKAITQQFQNAQERHSATMRELNTLVKAGAISWATYGRAADAAKAQMGTGWDRITRMMDGAHNSITRVGQSTRQLGNQASMYLTAPIIAFGAASVHEFSRFDDAAHKAFAIIQPQTQALKDDLIGLAKSMSTKSDFDAAGLVGGLKELAAAGLDAKQSMGALPVVESFATAGAFDLANATQLLMDSQSALGMVEKDEIKNRENLLKISDALVRAGDQSTASPKQFAEALSTASADAKQFGLSLEETMSVLDAYAMKGNKGTAAGSDMARALRLTTRAVNENGDVWKRYGMDVKQQNGEMKGFIEIIEQIEKAMVGMAGPQKAMMLQQLGFEALAQNAILPLVGMSDQMKVWNKEQHNSADYTKNVAKIQMESFASQMKHLTHEIQNAAAAIGEDLAPYVKSLATWIVEVAKSTGDWIRNNQSLAAGLIGVTAAIGPLLVISGTMLVMTGALSGAMAAMGATAAAAWIAYLGPIGVALVATTALTTAVVAFTSTFDGDADSRFQGTKTWNTELARSVDLNKQLADVQDRHNKEDITKANGLTGDDRLKALEVARQSAEQNVDGLKNHVKTTLAQIKQMEDANSSSLFRGFGLFGNKEVDLLKAKLKEYEASIAKTQGHIKDLAAEADRAPKAAGAVGPGGAVITPEMQEAAANVEDFIKKTKEANRILEEQAKLNDYSANAAKLLGLQVEGVSDAHMAEARAVHEANRALEAEKDAHEKAATAARQHESMIKDLESRVQTFGKSGHELEIYKAEINGLSGAELKHAKSLAAQLDSMEKNKKLQEEAAQLTKKHQTPLEKYTSEQGKLKEMFDAGYVSLSTYLNGLYDLQDELKKEFKLDLKTSGAEGMKRDSLSALVLLESFQQRKSGSSGIPSQYSKMFNADMLAAVGGKKPPSKLDELAAKTPGVGIFAGAGLAAEPPKPLSKLDKLVAAQGDRVPGGGPLKPLENGGAIPGQGLKPTTQTAFEKTVVDVLREIATNTGASKTTVILKAAGLRG